MLAKHQKEKIRGVGRHNKEDQKNKNCSEPPLKNQQPQVQHCAAMQYKLIRNKTMLKKIIEKKTYQMSIIVIL
jgi:hypothetical protein